MAAPALLPVCPWPQQWSVEPATRQQNVDQGNLQRSSAAQVDLAKLDPAAKKTTWRELSVLAWPGLLNMLSIIAQAHCSFCASVLLQPDLGLTKPLGQPMSLQQPAQS